MMVYPGKMVAVPSVTGPVAVIVAQVRDFRPEFVADNGLVYSFADVIK